jgi:hypothetical protein
MRLYGDVQRRFPMSGDRWFLERVQGELKMNMFPVTAPPF